MKKILFLLLISLSGFAQSYPAPVPNTYGYNEKIYEKSYFSDLTDFTSTGFTPTIVNNYINLRAGAGNFNQYVVINGSTNADETIEYQVTFRADTLGNGIAIGQRSINTFYSGSVSVFYSTNSNVIRLYDAEANTILIEKTSPISVAGDIFTLKYIRVGSRVTGVVVNETQKTTTTVTVNNNLSTSVNFKIPNTNQLRIWNIGGSMAILSIRAISHLNYNAPVLFVGDSKTIGYSAKTTELRFPSLLGYGVYGGAGDRTTELLLVVNQIIALKPKRVVLCIGRNDIGSGTSSGTWQSNYTSIVNSLTAAGIDVYHLYGIGETAVSQAALNTFIVANYAASQRIDVSSGWVNATMLSSDNVHPNDNGHRYIANAITATGKLPVSIFREKVNSSEKVLTGTLPDITTTGRVPFSTAGNYTNSTIYQDTNNNLIVSDATTTPSTYGTNFRILEVLGSGINAYTILSLGLTGNTKRGYITSDVNGGLSIGTTTNGISGATSLFNLVQSSLNIGIGTAAPNASAILDLSSTGKGVLIPRLTTAQRTGISTPATGLLVYDTDFRKIWQYNGTAWEMVASNKTITTDVYDAPSILGGSASTPRTVTVTGAALGDLIRVTVNVDQQQINIIGYVSATNTVTYYLRNDTAAPIDLGSATYTIYRQ